MTKYTGRELHMLRTLRQIHFSLWEAQNTTEGDWFDLTNQALRRAFPFTVTGPTDAEIEKLIAEDRQSHGWPTQEPK